MRLNPSSIVDILPEQESDMQNSLLKQSIVETKRNNPRSPKVQLQSRGGKRILQEKIRDSASYSILGP